MAFETNDTESLAAQSRWAPLWGQFQGLYNSENTNNYGQQHTDFSRQYGSLKAYQQRRDYELTLLDSGFDIETIAIMRAMNANYETIAQSPEILSTGQFYNQALYDYSVDETAYAEYAFAFEQLRADSNNAIIRFFDNNAGKFRSETKIKELYDNLNEFQVRKLKMLDMYEYDTFKNLMSQVAQAQDIERNSGGNWFDFATDTLKNFVAGAWDSFTDMFITIYDVIPTVGLMIPGLENNQILRSWAESGKYIRKVASQPTDQLRSSMKHWEGGQGFAMDVSGALGSITGIVAAFGVTAGVSGVSWGGSTAGKVASSAWVATQQGYGVVEQGLEEGMDYHELRAAYAGTVALNMALLAATGAVPGSEIVGGEKLLTIARGKQFAASMVKEGLEENFQQNIENYALQFSKGDQSFAKTMKDISTNFDPKTFAVSALASGILGASSHMSSNRAVNKTFDYYSEITPVMEGIKKDVQANPSSYGLNPNKKVSEIVARDRALDFLMSSGDPVVVARLVETMGQATLEAGIENYVKNAYYSYAAAEKAFKSINEEAYNLAGTVAQTPSMDRSAEIQKRFGYIDLGWNTEGLTLEQKNNGTISPAQFRLLYALNDFTQQREVLNFGEETINSFEKLKQNEVKSAMDSLDAGIFTENDMVKLHKAQEVKTDLDTITYFTDNDFNISYWNEAYGKYNVLDQQTYTKIKDQYNANVNRLKSHIANNNVDKINSIAGEMSPEQLASLSRVADGVKLTSMELKALNKLGFKTGDSTIDNYIDTAVFLEKNMKAKTPEQFQKIKDRVAQKFGGLDNVDLAELNKYITNKMATKLLSDDITELVDRAAYISEVEKSINDVLKAQEKEVAKVEKAKEEARKISQQNVIRQILEKNVDKLTNKDAVNMIVNENLRTLEKARLNSTKTIREVDIPQDVIKAIQVEKPTIIEEQIQVTHEEIAPLTYEDVLSKTLPKTVVKNPVAEAIEKKKAPTEVTYDKLKKIQKVSVDKKLKELTKDVVQSTEKEIIEDTKKWETPKVDKESTEEQKLEVTKQKNKVKYAKPLLSKMFKENIFDKPLKAQNKYVNEYLAEKESKMPKKWKDDIYNWTIEEVTDARKKVEDTKTKAKAELTTKAIEELGLADKIGKKEVQLNDEVKKELTQIKKDNLDQTIENIRNEQRSWTMPYDLTALKGTEKDIAGKAFLFNKYYADSIVKALKKKMFDPTIEEIESYMKKELKDVKLDDVVEQKNWLKNVNKWGEQAFENVLKLMDSDAMETYEAATGNTISETPTEQYSELVNTQKVDEIIENIDIEKVENAYKEIEKEKFENAETEKAKTTNKNIELKVQITKKLGESIKNTKTVIDTLQDNGEYGDLIVKAEPIVSKKIKGATITFKDGNVISFIYNSEKNNRGLAFFDSAEVDFNTKFISVKDILVEDDGATLEKMDDFTIDYNMMVNEPDYFTRPNSDGLLSYMASAYDSHNYMFENIMRMKVVVQSKQLDVITAMKPSRLAKRVENNFITENNFNALSVDDLRTVDKKVAEIKEKIDNDTICG